MRGDIIPFFADRSSLTRSLADQMDKLMNELFSKDFFPGALAKGSYPKMNVYDDDGNLCIDAYVPELPRDKIHIDVNKDRVLTLRGESNQDQETDNDKYYCREVSRRAFSRSVKLPDNVETEKISAKLTDGMLKVKIPYDKGSIKEAFTIIKIE